MNKLFLLTLIVGLSHQTMMSMEASDSSTEEVVEQKKAPKKKGATKKTLAAQITPIKSSQEIEESETPSSEQRKLIMRNRSSMERSGSIPKKHSPQLTPCIIAIPHVVFSPTILPCLLKLIDEEEEQIIGACYEFDDPILAKAWCNAHKNHNLTSELVVNRSSLNSKKDMKTVISSLVKGKIAVYQNSRRHEDTNNAYFGIKTYRSGKKNNFQNIQFFENMHHKFFIFSSNKLHGTIVVTGSFNWTKAANDRNWENIVILNDPTVIEQFIKQWQELEEHREPVRITA